MRRTITLLTCLSLLVPLGARPAAAGGKKICYSDNYDWDRDGYAKGAPEAEVGTKISCPYGYVKWNNDCNDTSSRVHPRSREIVGNNTDDNCRAGVDEAEPQYSPTGNQNTQTGFAVTVRLVHADTIALGNDLHGRVDVTPLDGHTGTVFSPVHRTQLFQNRTGTGDRYARFSVSGLAPERAYQATVRFFRPDLATTVGTRSGVYYTATRGSSEMANARTDIILKALNEVQESDESRVGYKGTVDRNGTRYGAPADEAWCTEFYSWNAKLHIGDGMSSNDSTDRIANWFAGYWGGLLGPAQVATTGQPGDWLGLDPGADEGKRHHSAMLLAVNGDKVWTVEGNTGNASGHGGNSVTAKQRSISGDVTDLGHLNTGMLS